MSGPSLAVSQLPLLGVHPLAVPVARELPPPPPRRLSEREQRAAVLLDALRDRDMDPDEMHWEDFVHLTEVGDPRARARWDEPLRGRLDGRLADLARAALLANLPEITDEDRLRQPEPGKAQRTLGHWLRLQARYAVESIRYGRGDTGRPRTNNAGALLGGTLIVPEVICPWALRLDVLRRRYHRGTWLYRGSCPVGGGRDRWGKGHLHSAHGAWVGQL